MKELCPHCGRPMPKPNGPCQIYVAQVLTYGAEHPTKIGVAKNAEQRCFLINRIGTSPISLVAVFEVETRKRAYEVEKLVKRSFAKDPNYANEELGTEVLEEDCEKVIRFVKLHAPDARVVKGA